MSVAEEGSYDKHEDSDNTSKEAETERSRRNAQKRYIRRLVHQNSIDLADEGDNIDLKKLYSSLSFVDEVENDDAESCQNQINLKPNLIRQRNVDSMFLRGSQVISDTIDEDKEWYGTSLQSELHLSTGLNFK
uniref:IBB domain-containing protein n=1 Tax=Syphacia muris TaxID=451379 RepID=A0A0N5A9X0_9BILA